MLSLSPEFINVSVKISQNYVKLCLIFTAPDLIRNFSPKMNHILTNRSTSGMIITSACEMLSRFKQKECEILCHQTDTYL